MCGRLFSCFKRLAFSALLLSFLFASQTQASSVTHYSMAPALSCSAGFLLNANTQLCHKQTSSTDTQTPSYSCPSGYNYSSANARCEKTISSTEAVAPSPSCNSGYSYFGSDGSCRKSVTLTTEVNQSCPSGQTLQNGQCYTQLSGSQCKTHASAVRSCQSTSSTYSLLEYDEQYEDEYIYEFKWAGQSIGAGQWYDQYAPHVQSGFVYWVGAYDRFGWQDVYYDDWDEYYYESYSYEYYQACRCDQDQSVLNSTSTKSCPSGYSLNSGSTQCQKPHTYVQTPRLSCNSGYALSGNQCIKTTSTLQTAARITSCPSSYNLNPSSGLCEAASEVAEPSASCSVSGYSYSTLAKTCQKPMQFSVSSVSTGSDYFNSFPTSGEVVGTLPGNVTVTPSGAATYSIPLSVPLGVGEFTPNISLNYNSNDGNGLLGKGWRLNAQASSISRCAPNKQNDVNKGPINFTNRDRFCMGSQRLELLTGTYGAPGSTYTTEFETYSRIEAVGGSTGHPSYFIVTGKAGNQTVYGDSNNSRRRTKDGIYTLRWATSKRLDVSGNAIRYQYYNSNHEFYLERVNYAYTGSSPSSSVRFHYETRNDPTLKYLAGGTPSLMAKRLHAISVHNSQELKRYTLTYNRIDEGQLNNVSRVTGIQECSGDLCLPKTTFEWTHNPVSYEENPIDAGSKIDHVIDLNRDGIDDILYSLYGSIYRRLGTGTGFSAQEKIGDFNTSDGYYNLYRLFDVNSDGLLDIVQQQESLYVENINETNSYKENYQTTVFLSHFDGSAWGHTEQTLSLHSVFVRKVQRGEPRGGSNDPNDFFKFTKRHRLLDINGDGLLDIVHPFDIQKVNTPFSGVVNTAIAYLLKSFEVQLGLTPNSDGLPRFAESYLVTVPEGVYYHESREVSPSSVHDGREFLADVDGDGSVEFVNSQGGLTYRIPSQAGPIELLAKQVGSGRPNVKVDHIRDFNKDGIADIVSRNCGVPTQTEGAYLFSVDYYICDEQWFIASLGSLGTSDGYLNDISLTGEVEYSPGGSFFKDFDLDGYDDLWVRGKPRMLWRKDKFVAHDDTTYEWPTTLGATARTLKTGIDYGHFIIGKDNKAYKSKNVEPIAKIKAVVNGLGARTEIDYAPMGTTSHYKAAGDIGNKAAPIKDTLCLQRLTGGCETIYDAAANSSADLQAQLTEGVNLPPNADTLPKENRIRDNYRGRTLVTQVHKTKSVDDGENQSNQRITMQYFYGRARTENTRGSLGFETMVTKDLAAGLETQTVYRQDFPLTGRSYFTQIRHSQSGHILSNKYTEHTIKTAARPYEVYASKTTEVAYHNESGDPIKEVITNNSEPDAWGNSAITTAITKGEGVERTITSTNTYGDYFHTRRGLISQNTIQTEVVYDSGRTENSTRVNAFTYTDTGLLKTTTTEPDSTNFKVVNTKYHDTYGNIIQESVATSGISTRHTYTDYDSYGRFVWRTRNSLNHVTSEVVNRNNYGQVTQVKSVNGAIAYSHYNALGQQMASSNNAGGWSKTALSNCDAGCPPLAAYSVTQNNADGSWSRAYQDAWGRTVRTEAPNLNGNIVKVDVGYNAQGSKAYQSQPFSYSYSDPDYHTYYGYNDKLQRLTHVFRPGQYAIVNAYKGLITERKNAQGLWTKETTNALGQVVEIEDVNGAKVINEYDAQGNLVYTRHLGSSDDPHNIVIELRYDLVGRKIYMNDPDKGVWTYDYNAFGEMTKQTDAMGNTQTFQYDVLGRQFRRTDRTPSNQVESHTRWYFDGTAPNGQTYPNAVGVASGVVHSGSTAYEQCGQSTVQECSISLYDNLGRPTKMWRSVGIGGNAVGYMQETEYDDLGRPTKTYDALNGIVGESGTYVAYNSLGFNTGIYDLATDDMLYQVDTVNDRGQLTQASHGNGATSQYSYDDETGRLLLQTAHAFTYQFQHIEYDWYGSGHLSYRKNIGGDNIAALDLQKQAIFESYCYDNLKRLIGVKQGGNAHCSSLANGDQRVTYDSIGNITYKHNVGNYSYGTRNGQYAGPHAVTYTSDGTHYYYNANGSLTSDTQRSLKYTAFDKPYEIYHNQSSTRTTFAYGSDRSRWKRQDTDTGTSQTTTTLYLGNIERVTQTGSNEILWKRTIGGSVINTITTNATYQVQSSTWQYLFKDIQGSLDVITDGIGSVVEDVSFDVWGERRKAHDGSALTASEKRSFNQKLEQVGGTALNQRITTRGYTEHEMLDAVGLIHMNGRVYDAKLARFVSADPLIPDPMNTQSYNRYSYVYNQPTYYTDPSGYNPVEEVIVIGTRIPDSEPDFEDTLEGFIYELYELANSADDFGDEFEPEFNLDAQFSAVLDYHVVIVNGEKRKARGYQAEEYARLNGTSVSISGLAYNFLGPNGGRLVLEITADGVSVGAQKDPKAIVLHRTGGTTAEGAINAMKKSGLGVHYVVAKDGTVHITASLDTRPYHVGKIRARCAVEESCSASEAAAIKKMGWAPAAISRREVSSKSYPARYPTSAESIGIEVVAAYNSSTNSWDAATAEQLKSINDIVTSLQSTYGLTDADVYQHDVISYKTRGEGGGLGY